MTATVFTDHRQACSMLARVPTHTHTRVCNAKQQLTDEATMNKNSSIWKTVKMHSNNYCHKKGGMELKRADTGHSLLINT